MKKAIKLITTFLLTLSCVLTNAGNMKGEVDFKLDDANKKVDVFINTKYFTSFIYPDNMEKQVLYPIYTISGKDVTRGFPLNPRPFERTDHPHHVGLWFNFGDVNGLDFWNNSFAIKQEDKYKYGSIKFDRIEKMNASAGELKTVANWTDNKGNVLLEERTKFIFSEINGSRFIERITTLTAKQKEVVFTENKEGILGLRVDRAFEEPSQKAEKYLDSNGNMTETPVLNNEGVNGVYRNADGITGGDVWGKKSKWVALRANKNGEMITIVMMDHHKNPNYPAWSHARGYGLFAMNNLAGRAVDKNASPVKITLREGDKITFRHKIIIGGDLTDKQIDKLHGDFN
ncbi:MAG: PmoA family protein [Porphyromonadaceae bacterium]|nr:PmoA family protein [Porphyromonadaceae bacterium]